MTSPHAPYAEPDEAATRLADCRLTASRMRLPDPLDAAGHPARRRSAERGAVRRDPAVDAAAARLAARLGL